MKRWNQSDGLSIGLRLGDCFSLCGKLLQSDLCHFPWVLEGAAQSTLPSLGERERTAYQSFQLLLLFLRLINKQSWTGATGGCDRCCTACTLFHTELCLRAAPRSFSFTSRHSRTHWAQNWSTFLDFFSPQRTSCPPENVLFVTRMLKQTTSAEIWNSLLVPKIRPCVFLPFEDWFFLVWNLRIYCSLALRLLLSARRGCASLQTLMPHNTQTHIEKEEYSHIFQCKNQPLSPSWVFQTSCGFLTFPPI